MAETALDTQATAKAEKPKRNPTERILVWGLILIGVVIICTEGTARIGYSMSLNALRGRVHDDEGEDSNPLTLSEADTMIVGFPARESGEKKVTYRFQGLVKEFGAIHLYHDDEDYILGLETDAPPEVEEPEVADGVDEEFESSEGSNDRAANGESGGSAMGGGSRGERGAGGSGSGRRNFDPMQFDEDKDGKISLEEAPDQLKERFSEIDANGDGFLDAEEFAARRAAGEQERGGEATEDGRPQRLETEENESEPAKEVLESIEKTE